MKLGYEQRIEQTQKLVMTPDLIQAIRILQYNTQDLEEYVNEELLDNPLIELINDRAIPYSFPYGYRSSKSDEDFDMVQFIQDRYQAEKRETLKEHLLFQLETTCCHEKCKVRGRYIINAMDENGYLFMPLSEIAEKLNTTTEKVFTSLKRIQGFEPKGVGARSLQECLLLQLSDYMCSDRNDQDLKLEEEDYRLTKEVIENHLEDLAENKVLKITKALSIQKEKLQCVSDIIKTLEPKPGRWFESKEASRFIVPDLKIEKTDDRFSVSIIDDNVPQLKISSYYNSLKERAESDVELRNYLTKKINSALWLIKSIEQRKDTILKIAKAIINYQQEFFEKGPECLRILTLKQIADEVGVHESTVSRSINDKYIDTPLGVYELKYFFQSGVKRCKDSYHEEESISATGVKAIMRELIEEEDTRSPLSDQEIMKVLMDKGIDISRRTIAKYREEEGILSSPRRKRY